MSFRALRPSWDWSAPQMALQKSRSAMLGAWPSFCRLRANMKSKFALSSPPSLGGCRLLFLSCLSRSSTGGKKKNSSCLRDAAKLQLKQMPVKYSRFIGICAGTKEAQTFSSHRTSNIKSATIKGYIAILIFLLISNTINL